MLYLLSQSLGYHHATANLGIKYTPRYTWPCAGFVDTGYWILDTFLQERGRGNVNSVRG